MKYAKVQEEALKNSVARDFFGRFDHTMIIGEIDFAVKNRGKNLPDSYFLWAEAKAAQTDVCEMLAQLVLTIGKARTFDKITPPPFLGCFDREKIAFVPYHAIQEIFYQNDFNWNVAPSKRDTPQFKQVCELIKSIIDTDNPNETYRFNFKKDEKTLKQFIVDNFVIGKSDTAKIRIDKNNFISIYNRWVEAVKPTIAVDWKLTKKSGIIDGDFYLADLLSRENKTLKEKLFVLLKTNYYELDRKIDTEGFISSRKTDFTDNQKAHHQFWAIYERPPLEEYWDYIIERRDLLVPQDIRERKGSFFTPQIWVELSQKYIADVLGADWQDEYYVWDCAAGTGNLLAGLANKYRIWASTIDKADVDVMHDRIDNGANLLKDHVFQFDFLNDDFDKLPKGLKDIIYDENERKKLIIYINPPYAEASKKRTLGRGKEGDRGVEQSMVNQKYAQQLGQGNAELFAQFFTRIYCEINGAILAEFSKLKILQGQHFINFREFFLAKLEKMFVCPSNTFDNVKGSFPIGFMIWDTSKQEKFKRVTADVYDRDGMRTGKKRFYACDDNQYMNEWIKPFRAKKNDKTVIGKFPFKGNDFQNQNMIVVVNPEMDYNVEAGQFLINANNLIQASIYFAVRKVIPANWLNDRDQFLRPSTKWKKDTEFQNDCLAYTLFSNNIQSKHGVNHWIPFLENEINARSKFDSHFMVSFISGKLIQNRYADLFEQDGDEGFIKREFSATAKAVFAAGRKLWTYYHSQSKSNVNASLYDIREHFQGRNAQGRMNNKSVDETYNGLIAELRSALKTLATKIEPKVYEYGFLKE